jgi:hypothetical protein
MVLHVSYVKAVAVCDVPKEGASTTGTVFDFLRSYHQLPTRELLQRLRAGELL